ncbi:MAG: hypothetical protein NTW96_09030 [Planctomycetia bacterium]|nr:hypothetical protein [Planctomycetia bacterium]
MRQVYKNEYTSAMGSLRELQFRTYNTRRNLPMQVRGKRGEANFLGAFARALVREIEFSCVYGRNFSMSGCGIADLVLCQVRGKSVTRSAPDMCLLAFEAKLLDWRGALQQAYRYRYYADSSFVVIPAENATPAISRRQLFEQFGLGLWTFDRVSGIIHRVVSPPHGIALNRRKREAALAKIQRCVFNLREPAELAQSFLDGD